MRIRTLLAILTLPLLTALPALAEGAASAHAEHADHGGADPMSLNWKEMAFSAGLFVVFAAILGLFVWPRILKGLQAREAKITGDLQAAETAAKEAQAKLAELNQQLADAQKQAQKVVDEARQAAGSVAAKVKADAEKEVADLKNQALREIKAAKEQAVAEVGAQVADLSAAVAGKILARQISAADQQDLVAAALAQVAAKN